MKKISAFTFILLFSFNFTFSADSTEVKHKNIWHTFVSDIEISVKQGLSFYSVPFHLSGRQWLYTGMGAAAFGVVMTQDRNIKEKFSKSENRNSIWYYAKQYGEIKYAAAGSVLIYGTGLLAHEDEIRITGRMLLQSLFYSGSVTLVLKSILGRSRPYLTDNQYTYNWFQTNDDKMSLPSGHATVAFAVSTVFAERINTWWSRAVFYPLALITSLSRVHDNMHWMSDVMLGGAIGFGAGYFTTHYNDKKSGSEFSITPAYNGISLQYSF